jgi:SAM-dependent methyltransferase
VTAPELNRIIVIDRALRTVGDDTYLEIGVDTGVSFIATRAQRKWGVDPSPKLTGRRRFKYAVFAALHLGEERIFPVTSDDFFLREKRRLSAHGVNVALIDGLHTYEQTLRDTRNVLEYLRPGGIIVLHDCNPTSALMATPASSMEDMIERSMAPDWSGAWTGDVWKVITHIRSLWDDVNAFVLDCDFGVGVVTRGVPEMKLPYSENEIREMSYSFLDANRRELLGLRPPAFFDDFLSAHARRHNLRSNF